MEMRGQLHDPATLALGQQPRYPLNGRLGGRQGQSRPCALKTNVLRLPETETVPCSPQSSCGSDLSAGDGIIWPIVLAYCDVAHTCRLRLEI
jgi:hypothetical protein